MDKHKISIRVIIDQYQKYLIKNVIIKSKTDMWLKIRDDLSIKNMQDKEVEGLMEENKFISIGGALLH